MSYGPPGPSAPPCGGVGDSDFISSGAGPSLRPGAGCVCWWHLCCTSSALPVARTPGPLGSAPPGRGRTRSVTVAIIILVPRPAVVPVGVTRALPSPVHAGRLCWSSHGVSGHVVVCDLVLHLLSFQCQ